MALRPISIAITGVSLLLFGAAPSPAPLPPISPDQALLNGLPVVPDTQPVLPRDDPGAFPAHSFFDVFVEIQLPGITEVDRIPTAGDGRPEDITLTNNTGAPVTIDDVDYGETTTSTDVTMLPPGGVEGLPVDFDIQFIPIDLNPGQTLTLKVSQFPEPASFALLGAVLAGVHLTGRRKRAR